MKLLDYAAQYQIKSWINGPTDISPAGTAAAIHPDLASRLPVNRLRDGAMHDW